MLAQGDGLVVLSGDLGLGFVSCHALHVHGFDSGSLHVDASLEDVLGRFLGLLEDGGSL